MERIRVNWREPVQFIGTTTAQLQLTAVKELSVHRVARPFNRSVKSEFSHGISQCFKIQCKQRGMCLMARFSPQATSLPPREKQISIIHSNNYQLLL